MILGVITVPQKTIIGTFNIIFSFQHPLIFSMADVEIETLLGDALGDSRDCLTKAGDTHYMFQCYIPTGKCGKSRISVNLPDVSVKPVEIVYDTKRVVVATWGTPVKEVNVVHLPVSVDASLRILKKRNFRLSPAVPYQLYRVGTAYQLLITGPFQGSVTISGNVVKTNGVEAYIQESVLEV